MSSGIKIAWVLTPAALMLFGCGETRELTFYMQKDAGGSSSGVYYCRLQAGEFNQTRKVLLQK